MTTTCYHKTMPSPVGTLTLIASDQGLVAVLWDIDKPERFCSDPLVADDAHPLLLEAERQLNAYFAGQLSQFNLALDFRGSDFQKTVWSALLQIPFGETRSYGQIARSIGQPNAARAVGLANSQNPISIIAPCHRVIGADGALTGYAGGLERKLNLLQREGRWPTLAATVPPTRSTRLQHGAITA